MEIVRQKIEEVVASSPDATAVVSSGTAVSYREFRGQVAAVQKVLSEAESFSSQKVTILAGQNSGAYAGMVATLISGGSYNPISLETPRDRIATYLDVYAPDIVLVDSSGEQLIDSLGLAKPYQFDLIRVDLLTPLPDQGIESKSPQSESAYVIFTSGSTGAPKGVEIGRSNLEFLINWLRTSVPWSRTGRVSQFSPIGFDLSVAEIFLALGTGMALVPPANHLEKLRPLKTVSKRQITHLVGVPSMLDLAWREFATVRPSSSCDSVQFVLQIGEPLLGRQVQAARVMFPKVKDLWNCYGPTESTVICSVKHVDIAGEWSLDDASIVSIGRPLPEHTFTIERPDDRGVGELVISGPLVGLGYTPSEINSASFFSSQAGRSFRTGDLVREGTTGDYDFHGRADRQVKVRGVRLELGDIESCLGPYLKGSSAVVITDGVLVVFTDDCNIRSPGRVRALMQSLQGNLRSELIPTKYFYLREIPLSLNGKVDLGRLTRLASKLLSTQ